MQDPPSLFRVFHFVCDDLPYGIAVDHSPDLAGQEQERYLTEQFHSLLEIVLPERRAAGKIADITWFDAIHPELPPDSRKSGARRSAARTGLAHHAVAEWNKVVAH
jgi:hypothetical protein